MPLKVLQNLFVKTQIPTILCGLEEQISDVQLPQGKATDTSGDKDT